MEATATKQITKPVEKGHFLLVALLLPCKPASHPFQSNEHNKLRVVDLDYKYSFNLLALQSNELK